MKKIFVSDITLRKLAEERKVPLLFREKTAIAACIDEFGADALELAAIKKEKEDSIIYKTIAATVKNSAVCLPVGAEIEGVKTAWEAIQDAVKPCLVVSFPTSTVTMEYQYHLKEAKMKEKAVAMVAECRKYCQHVQFVATDATRADISFLIALGNAVKEAGACAMTLCDDAGIAMPEDFAKLVADFKKGCDIKLFVEVNDSMNMANANAFAALNAGADGVKTASVGTSVLSTADFANVLKVKGDSLGIESNLKLTELRTDIKQMTKKLQRDDFQQADNSTMGGDIILDSDSTQTDVQEAVQKLGYDLSAEDIGNVYERMHHFCERKSSVGGKELEAIIASEALQVPATYHIKSYTLTSSNLAPTIAHIVLVRDNHILEGMATGDGPIDTIFRAIEDAVGYHYELDDFQIAAVTEGKEALGSCLVKLRSNGKLYSGNGTSNDIISSSIRSYVNAMNKITYDEES